MPTEYNETEVARRMDRLLEAYGDVPIAEPTWEDSPEEFAQGVEYAENGYVGGAYAWVVRRPEDAPALSESMPDDAADDRKRALMILNRGSDEWGLAGGGVEDGETYEETARREVREETNVECSPTDLFMLRRATVVCTGDRDDRIHLLFAFFDATYEGGEIAIQPGELHGAAWFADPPARLLPANERRAESW